MHNIDPLAPNGGKDTNDWGNWQPAGLEIQLKGGGVLEGVGVLVGVYVASGEAVPKEIREGDGARLNELL